jgi:hypothetical protein
MQAGDIILRRANDAPCRYTLSSSGGAPQIACGTYQEALSRAERFARSRGVDVWQTDDGHAFTRVVESRGAPLNRIYAGYPLGALSKVRKTDEP